MSMVNFDLQPEWLRRHEVGGSALLRAAARRLPGAGGARRSFRVPVGGEEFILSVRHVPASAAEAFSTPAEEEREPTDAEVLFLLARAFLGSLPSYPPQEPDIVKAWTIFRRQMLEALPAGMDLGTWQGLAPDVREAYAAGIRAGFDPSTISHPPPAISPQP